MSDFRSYEGKSGNGGGKGANGAENERDARAFIEENKNKTEEELLAEIFREAARRRAEGTLTDAEIDAFAAAIRPRLSGERRRKFDEVLKRIRG